MVAHRFLTSLVNADPSSLTVKAANIDRRINGRNDVEAIERIGALREDILVPSGEGASWLKLVRLLLLILLVLDYVWRFSRFSGRFSFSLSCCFCFVLCVTYTRKE